ncbi:hypothetical protein PanWU01x14_316550 [Parasponia andersonii]|uniref:Uncharacterized protein n=1 Tax=Parasponia andersonii TaxID=3476 RepID=A0A2P5AMZ7_PARAD|nr:hypothetical protein PanWU01x14_316550 [Parasponia andersonii]
MEMCIAIKIPALPLLPILSHPKPHFQFYRQSTISGPKSPIPDWISSSPIAHRQPLTFLCSCSLIVVGEEIAKATLRIGIDDCDGVNRSH